jgi:hypothetical protein
MNDFATCKIAAEMPETDPSVAVYFDFSRMDDADAFFEILGKAIENGSIKIGPLQFPPAKTVSGAADETAPTELTDIGDVAQDERWNAGVDFALHQLCAFLSVDPSLVQWDGGTETAEGDVRDVVASVFRSYFGDDWEPGDLSDTHRVDLLQREYLKVDPFPMPTPGGDDADVGWRVSQYHMGKPAERVVAEVYIDDVRKAIDASANQINRAAAHET